MASAGLPFLLLVLSALLISTGIGPTSANQDQLQRSSSKDSEKVKEWFLKTQRKIFNNLDRITKAVSPFLLLIPVYGGMISGLVQFAGSEIATYSKYSDMDLLMDELENLNIKIDKYYQQQKWDIWTSSAYQEKQTKIEAAWDVYRKLLDILKKEKNEKEREKHKENFKKEYLKYSQITNELHKVLISAGHDFNYPLGDLLSTHANCHEKMIIHYTKVITNLIYKGNTMSILYYNLQNFTSEALNVEADLLTKYAYDAAMVMFQIHQQCILSSMDYVINDVQTLINKTAKRSELAKQVWSSLDKDYDRYDWMVVAFLAKKSNHKICKILNRHTLFGFNKVTRNQVSVAVARQVKGSHTKAALVKAAIEKCINENVLCHRVPRKLSTCSETVGGTPVSQTFTAVHTYMIKAHDSHGAQEISDYDMNRYPEDISAQTPYIYKGNCHIGKFVVFIKSDEEIMSEDPCADLDCGENENRGRCVAVKDLFLGMCECDEPYYGQNCEESLKDYKKNLLGSKPIIVIYRQGRSGAG